MRIKNGWAMKPMMGCLVVVFALWSASAGLADDITTAGSGIWSSTTVGAPWPGGAVPASDDNVTIANGHTVTVASASNVLKEFTVASGATLLFTNWTACLMASNVTIASGGTMTLPAAFTNNAMSNRVWVICTNFTINSGGKIMADARGFAAFTGPGKGTTIGDYGNGAGYGGKGGSASGAGTVGGGIYGSTNAPLDPGSGGGHGYSAGGAAGGNGGGAVRIEASSLIRIDGTVTANGTNGFKNGSYYSGGGSGGSIFMTCETFGGSSNGILRANGGAGGSPIGGGGGGGRIAVNYTSVSAGTGVRFSANRGLGWVNVDANAPLYDLAAQMGTLSFPNSTLLDSALSTWNGNASWLNGYFFFQSTNVWSPSTLLVLSNSTVGIPAGSTLRITNDLTLTATGGVVVAAQARLTCDGNLLLTNGASLVAYGGETNAIFTNAYGSLVQVTNALTVASNCWIYPFSHSTNGGSVLFRVGSLAVNGGGGIDANYRGYCRVAGPGKGVTGAANHGGSGGGHGGKGGNGDIAIAGSWYGSTNVPITAGSGGGDGYSVAGTMGGHGGGVVWIEAAGGVTLDGTVRANGENGRINSAAYQSGGGAGGSIFMMCDSFGGTGGVLEAKGGSGGGTLGGSGGGGRISVAIGFSSTDRAKLVAGQEIAGLVANQQDPSFEGTISVTNGVGWTNLPPGGAEMGTRQFLKVQAASERFVTIDGAPGQYGLPTPNGYASWPVEAGTVFTNAVTTPAGELNGLRRSCFGWRVTDTALGTPMSSNTTTQAVFTVNTNLTLTWLWTNEYQLAFAPGPNGMVNSNSLNGWYTNATPVSITATANEGYYFVAWFGTDVPSGPATNNPLSIPMDQPRTNITAVFASQAGIPITWNGVGNWMSHTNWTPPGVPGLNDSVLVQSGSLTVSEAYRIGSLLVNTNATLIFTNWTTRLTAGDVTVRSNGVMTLPPAFTEAQMSNRIWVACDNFTLNAGGKILADASGYAALSGFGKGALAYPTGGSGAGYGGKGGNGSVAVGGGVYGSTNAPLDPGSGGGHGYSAVGAAGGAGGGAVLIEVNDRITIDGAVTANGATGIKNHPYYAGGGSGGAIFMTCGAFGGSSNGSLQANGGLGSNPNGGGAGGGRIAVWIGLADTQKTDVLNDQLTRLSVDATNKFFTGNLSVSAGTGYTNLPPNGAEAGTIRFITFTARGTVFSIR